MGKIGKIGKFRALFQIFILIVTAFSLFKYSKFYFFATFFVGAFFCGWMCSFGTAQEWLFRFGQRVFKKKIEVPKNVHKILSKTRYFIMALGSFTILDTTYSKLMAPYSARKGFLTMLKGKEVAIILLIITVSFMILSMFVERAFCNYYCPKGAKYGLLGILRPFTIVRNEKTCIDCKLCDKSCPMKLDISITKRLVEPSCISCYKCIDSCPKKGVLKIGIK